MSSGAPFVLVACALGALAPGAAAQSERYVAFGDSITLGVGDEGGAGYPARLQALLAAAGHDAVVENEGVDGETTAEGLSRLAGLTGEAGDVLLILEGTNDLAREVSIETTLSNLRRMVGRARQVGFGPVHLATVLPRGRGVTTTVRRHYRDLADGIRQTAFEVSAGMPDPHFVFLHDPRYPNGIYSDTFHPNPDGYDLLADLFRDYLLNEDTVAPSPSFATPYHEQTGVPPDALLQVVLFDPLAGVDTDASTLTLDGEPIATEITGGARRAVLSSRPGNLSGQRLLAVDARDRNVPANRKVVDVALFTVRGTRFLAGDADQSGRVDGADLVLLGHAFGSRTDDSRYAASVDFDDNGRVDGSDLAILAANFGLSSF